MKLKTVLLIISVCAAFSCSTSQQTKKTTGEQRMMLSEMWMKGLIGGVPYNF